MPNVFNEALMWSCALSIWAIYFILRWFARGGSRHLLAATLLFCLGSNSRPTAGVIALALGGTLVAVLIHQRAFRISRDLVAACSLAVLPLALTAFTYWLKFRTPFPDVSLNQAIANYPGWQAIREANGGKFFGAIFIPTMLWAYLRPDSVTYFAHSINVQAHETVLWPAPAGGVYIEPTVSLTNIAPAFLLSVLLALWISPRALLAGGGFSHVVRCGPWVIRLFLLSTLAGSVLVLANVAASSRYIADFIPSIVVFVSFATSALALLFLQRPRLTLAITAILLLLVTVGVVMNLGLSASAVNARIFIHREMLPTHSWLWG
jgi:hypothetical protein